MTVTHNNLYSHVFPAMGSRCEIVIDVDDEKLAQKIFALAESETKRIEFKYSRYLPDSWLSQVNFAAGKVATPLDQESYQLLKYAENLYQVSSGLFDITSGIFRRAWDYKAIPKLPSQEQLDGILPLVSWPNVVWDEASVYLPKEGMEIDFGGYGKEYAVDRVAQILSQEGICSGYVNFAGDMRVIGPRENNEPWQMGIQNPRNTSSLVATIPLYAGALATSGDYERYFELDGGRYCHIINPKTGWPVKYWQSISVLAPLAVMAGSYSTIAMLLEDQGLDFLNRSNVTYLAINYQGQIYKKSAEKKE
jgi:thiamine biosynthesis lipoprotein